MTTPIDRAEIERGRTSEPLVRATGLHHVVLAVRDLAAAERFYCDFGLTVAERTPGVLYLRAADRAHHVVQLVSGAAEGLVSVAMSVASEFDLRKLASLPCATPVAATAEPGGGLRVRLTAPGGITFEAVHGIVELEPRGLRPPAEVNVTGAVERANAPVRVPSAASEILRIGHVALETTQPGALVLWLMRTFGMIVSDYQTLSGQPDVSPVVSFMRCDRGATPSDHHTLAVALGPACGAAHVAFEVRNLDEMGRGAKWLRERGHRHAWGVGRHLLGSQLFDYWRAPDGTVVEHYADGDVFAAAEPTGCTPFLGSNLLQWGPLPPLDFALPPLSLTSAARAARGIANSSELSLPLLARVVHALSR
jgi:catechol 2,3-dioxygenase-like lactoylglutathione lyase family enzyme